MVRLVTEPVTVAASALAGRPADLEIGLLAALTTGLDVDVVVLVLLRGDAGAGSAVRPPAAARAAAVDDGPALAGELLLVARGDLSRRAAGRVTRVGDAAAGTRAELRRARRRCDPGERVRSAAAPGPAASGSAPAPGTAAGR